VVAHLVFFESLKTACFLQS